MKLKRYGYVVLVFLLVFLGKISGFFKDMLFTYYYGISVITDGYFLANSISSLLYIAVYSAVPVLVVPIYSRLLAAGNRVAADEKLTATLVFFFSISLVLGISVAVFSHGLVELFTGAASAQVKSLAGEYLSIMALTFALSTVVAFLNALQTVNKRSLPSYIVPLVNNLIFCLGLAVFSTSTGLVGVLYLGVVAWLVLLAVNAWSSKSYFSIKVSALGRAFQDTRLLMLFLPAALSFYVEQVNGFVGVFFASQLEAGAISVLGYAGKLNLIFLSVFLVFLTASLFPKIAVLVASDDSQKLSDYLNSCVRIIFLCALPVIIFMVFYAHKIVELLFKRGKFGEEDVANVAVVLSIMLVAVPFGLVRDVMNRFFFSRGSTLTPVMLSLVALLLNFLVSFSVYQHFGLMGLAWAVVLSTVASFCIAIFFVRRDAGISLVLPNLGTLAVALSSATLATGLLLWMNTVFADFWMILCVPFACCYFAALYLCKVKESRLFIDRLMQMRRA